MYIAHIFELINNTKLRGHVRMNMIIGVIPFEGLVYELEK